MNTVVRLSRKASSLAFILCHSCRRRRYGFAVALRQRVTSYDVSLSVE